MLIITVSPALLKKIKGFGIKNVVSLPALAKMEHASAHTPTVSAKLKKWFVRAWLAYLLSDAGVPTLWQVPGTVWLAQPSLVLEHLPPSVETLWIFKGRSDKRAAPYYVSFDLFFINGKDRPIHLLHEVLMHIDLVAEWDSLDALASYRLTENNARYGTSTHTIPAHTVLHTSLLDVTTNGLQSSVKTLREVVADKGSKLLAIVPNDEICIGEGSTIKSFLISANLWKLATP